MKQATKTTTTATKKKPSSISEESGCAITITQSKLHPVLQALACALDTKQVMPVLAYALFDVKDGDVEVAATNLDLWVIEKLEALEVTGEGKFLLPLKRLLAFVQHSDGEIKITGNKDNKDIKVASGNARVNWQALAVKDFPDFPKPADELFAMPSAAFARAMKAIERIQAEVDVNYKFNNIYFETSGEKILVIASDGNRMGYAELPPAKETGSWDVLIPKKSVAPIIRVAEGNEEIFFGRKENHFYVNGGERRIISRLHTGQFPIDVAKRWVKSSENYPMNLAVNTFALHAALSRVIAACEEGKDPALRVTLTKGKLTVEVDRRDMQVGVATDAINVEFDGDKFEFGINHKFLNEACQIADNVTLRLLAPDKAVQMRVVGEEPILHIMMPRHPRAISAKAAKVETAEKKAA